MESKIITGNNPQREENPTHQEPMLLRVDEAAARLCISRSMLYMMLHDERLAIPVVRFGPRAIRIPRAALDAWVAERSRNAR